MSRHRPQNRPGRGPSLSLNAFLVFLLAAVFVTRPAAAFEALASGICLSTPGAGCCCLGDDPAAEPVDAEALCCSDSTGEEMPVDSVLSTPGGNCDCWTGPSGPVPPLPEPPPITPDDGVAGLSTWVKDGAAAAEYATAAAAADETRVNPWFERHGTDALVAVHARGVPRPGPRSSRTLLGARLILSLARIAVALN